MNIEPAGTGWRQNKREKEKMKHGQVHSLLPWYVNGTLPGRQRAAVEKHLAGCAPCRQALAEWRLVSDGVAMQPAPAIPAGTLAALLNRLESTSGRARPSGQTAWQVAVGFVALALMLLVVLLMPSAQLQLEWMASGSEPVESFTIYRSETAARPQETLLTAPAEELVRNGGYVYTDPSVRPNRSYYYWLEAQGATGTTALAGPITAVTDSTLLLVKLGAAICLLAGLAAGLWAARGRLNWLPLQLI